MNWVGMLVDKVSNTASALSLEKNDRNRMT